MNTLKINVKTLYRSVWLIILTSVSVGICFLLLVSREFNISSGQYVISDCMTVNIFLGVFIPIVSVFAVHRCKDIEYSLTSRKKLILTKYASVNIFCISTMIIPVFFLVVLSVVNGTSLKLVSLYIAYLFFVTLTQSLFLSAVSFCIGFLIKKITAYFIAVIIAFTFSPFANEFFFSNAYTQNLPNRDVINAMFNLICLSWDDRQNIKYTAFGISLNIETILSWIITILIAFFILLVLLLFKRSFKSKGIITLLSSCCVVLFTLSVVTINLYFENSPVGYNYRISYADDGTSIYPTKIDLADNRSEDFYNKNSPTVSEYRMDLKTGTIVKNVCSMIVEPNGNHRLRVKLDQCFNINSISVNNRETEFTRDGDYFILDIPQSSDILELTVNYNGRINYMDALNNKVDFCDIRGGYLSKMFAWYPKIISEKNNNTEKHFFVEIDAVNDFITNLNSCSLIKKGKSTVEGNDQEVFFYLGYISEMAVNGYKVILPTEYVNIPVCVEQIKTQTEYLKMGDSSIFNTLGLYDSTFSYDGELTDEEIDVLLEKWSSERKASIEEKKAVNTLICMPCTYGRAFTAYIDKNIYFICEYGIFAR